jgi:hypothetical protein
MTSLIITLLLGLMKMYQRLVSKGVPSGRERFGIRISEKRHRLEPVAACPAMPEIRRAVRTVFNPLRSGDQLAALGTGIFSGLAGILSGQIAELCSGHGASPFSFLSFLLERIVCFSSELDRMIAGCGTPGPVVCKGTAEFCLSSGNEADAVERGLSATSANA